MIQGSWFKGHDVCKYFLHHSEMLYVYSEMLRRIKYVHLCRESWIDAQERDNRKRKRNG